MAQLIIDQAHTTFISGSVLVAEASSIRYIGQDQVVVQNGSFFRRYAFSEKSYSHGEFAAWIFRSADGKQLTIYND
tara:strand:- start:386 stop:613 length:228 start_codon:yes stop_codon:yes gene_type:complete